MKWNTSHQSCKPSRSLKQISYFHKTVIPVRGYVQLRPHDTTLPSFRGCPAATAGTENEPAHTDAATMGGKHFLEGTSLPKHLSTLLDDHKCILTHGSVLRDLCRDYPQIRAFLEACWLAINDESQRGSRRFHYSRHLSRPCIPIDFHRGCPHSPTSHTGGHALPSPPSHLWPRGLFSQDSVLPISRHVRSASTMKALSFCSLHLTTMLFMIFRTPLGSQPPITFPRSTTSTSILYKQNFLIVLTTPAHGTSRLASTKSLPWKFTGTSKNTLQS